MATPRIEFLPVVTPTGWGRIVSLWAKMIGIPLIIGLELTFLLLFAFLAKLELDLRLLDFSVKEKERLVASAAPFEKRFRDTQIKLETIGAARQEICSSCALALLYKIKPVLVRFTTISLNQEKLALSGETPAGTSFALFVSRILAEKAVREAALTSGSLTSEGNFIFLMELILDKEKLR